MYKRYIDNIIYMFASEKDAENFFEFLNWQQKTNKNKKTKKKHVKYTLEKESNKFFSFLDILIKNEERNRFPKLVYPTKASIRLLTQFNSFRTMSYKTGLVRCLTYRTFKSSSSYIIFHNELEKVEILLLKKHVP